MRSVVSSVVILFLILLGSGNDSYSQGNLYTARGYWEETTKPNYLALKQKLIKGDSLTDNEKTYVADYEVYLRSYFAKLSQDDKDDYARLKARWDSELPNAQAVSQPSTLQNSTSEFEWRTRDRLSNALYGIWYGASLVYVANITGSTAGGIPLITGGLWMLGPAINPKKYENITRNTLRASNTGKLLGLGYGAGLGWALGGNSDSSGKWVFGFSTVGSILLGEIAFYQQQNKNFSAGHIEMMRHYGFIGPWIALASVVGAGVDNANVNGLAILGGGIGGLFIGSHVANKYDYSRGDADVISSLTLISTGVGFAFMAESYKTNTDLKSLLLIPAASSVIATILGQRAAKGANLTDKQGSTINLSAAGAALIGLGIFSVTKSESPSLLFGIPSGLALITHQVLFHKYKMENLEVKLRGSNDVKRKFNVSLKVTPESYLMNQQIPVGKFTPQMYANLQNPLFKLVITF